MCVVGVGEEIITTDMVVGEERSSSDNQFPKEEVKINESSLALLDVLITENEKYIKPSSITYLRLLY